MLINPQLLFRSITTRKMINTNKIPYFFHRIRFSTLKKCYIKLSIHNKKIFHEKEKDYNSKPFMQSSCPKDIRQMQLFVIVTATNNTESGKQLYLKFFVAFGLTANSIVFP